MLVNGFLSGDASPSHSFLFFSPLSFTPKFPHSTILPLRRFPILPFCLKVFSFFPFSFAFPPACGSCHDMKFFCQSTPPFPLTDTQDFSSTPLPLPPILSALGFPPKIISRYGCGALSPQKAFSLHEDFFFQYAPPLPQLFCFFSLFLPSNNPPRPTPLLSKP